MKQIAFATAATLCLALPAYAEEERGTSLMEEGAKLFFKGIMQEMEPALDELQGLADEIGPSLLEFSRAMGPALKDLLAEVEDWSVYEPLEMLPNGDIILRRKQPKAEVPQSDTPEIEL
ncbi:hypothetical protein [Pseudoprimorskyibacter insulae]|uniref:AAA+ family ATPase n=1 Tax=Pseudoprimorskyibacter insulae TaxID=1695997 RepID=A0A2R8ARC6_9RHOB|nr:hypothetical protein [Pseudoprimorskyibacter insulae]SPF78437.1 hypothetical protein PRI8871_01040 [Pseudoprimorskyibacter insulae]